MTSYHGHISALSFQHVKVKEKRKRIKSGKIVKKNRIEYKHTMTQLQMTGSQNVSTRSSTYD